MRLFLLLALARMVTPLSTASRSTHTGLIRHRAITMNWADRQRQFREEQQARYEAQAAARAEAEAERQAALEAKRAAEAKARADRDAAYAAYVDNLEFRSPGGVARQPTNVLTREGIEAANKISSPAILAEERLAKAVSEASGLPAADAADQLERLIAEARAVGVSSNSPQLKKATSLMGVLRAGAQEAGAFEVDPLAEQMSILFSDEWGGYSMPELDDE